MTRILTTREVRRAPVKALPGRTPDLTGEELERVRRALHSLHRKLGSWRVVARTLGVHYKTLEKAAGKDGTPTAGLAIRASRAAGVPLEEILTGAWPTKCPTCGRCD